MEFTLFFDPLPGAASELFETLLEISRRAYRNATRERENELTHRLLRAIHNDRAEYVYSETLNAHVRIGEPLKEKHG